MVVLRAQDACGKQMWELRQEMKTLNNSIAEEWKVKRKHLGGWGCTVIDVLEYYVGFPGAHTCGSVLKLLMAKAFPCLGF